MAWPEVEDMVSFAGALDLELEASAEDAAEPAALACDEDIATLMPLIRLPVRGESISNLTVVAWESR